MGCSMCVSAKLLSCVQLFANLWTLAYQAILYRRCSRQEHCSRLPRPEPEDLPNQGIESMFLTSPALTGGFSTTSATWEAWDVLLFPNQLDLPQMTWDLAPCLITELLPGRGALCIIFVGENRKSKSHSHWHKNATAPSERKFNHLPATKLGNDATFFVC